MQPQDRRGITNCTTRTKWIIASTFAALLLVGASTAGYVVASNIVISSTASTAVTASEQEAYKAGARSARFEFCNLRFGEDAAPTVDDPRTYDSLPSSVVVADDVCDPSLVAQWNDAQQNAGSDKRACLLDRGLTAIVGSYVCTAPTGTSY